MSTSKAMTSRPSSLSLSLFSCCFSHLQTSKHGQTAKGDGVKTKREGGGEVVDMVVGSRPHDMLDVLVPGTHARPEHP